MSKLHKVPVVVHWPLLLQAALRVRTRAAISPTFREEPCESEEMKLNGRRLVVLVALALPASAYAYVDPGSGMLMWQGLVALVGAVIVFIKNPVAAIKDLITRFKRK